MPEKTIIEIEMEPGTIIRIETPKDILDFMKKYIKYGWTDINGEKHKGTMKNFRKLYRTGTIEETLETKLGTCIEQVNLISHLLDLLQIPNKKFCTRIYEGEDFNNLEAEEHMHCFVLYYQNGKVYHLEHPNPDRVGIHEYATEEEALEDINNYYMEMTEGKMRPLTEFNHVFQNQSFKEFNEFINRIDVEKAEEAQRMVDDERKRKRIKELLIELKSNPQIIYELEHFRVNDVVEVAIESEMYESLMIAFQPITIDGETKICLDAFSSNILNILQTSSETKEEAEQQARKEYEYIRETNSKLSEEDRERCYNSSTYEDILSSKTIIPKEIKDSFKKILFTINYDLISKMKIKNCHARQISGWSHPIETVEDVIIYSELPSLAASIDLYNKNITTTMNDTEGVLEDSTIPGGVCKIWFEYDSLSQENKDIVEELILSGCAERFMDKDIETISIFVPCSKEETVKEVSDKLRAIVSKLKIQDIKYGFGSMEEIYQWYYAPTIEKFPYCAEGLFSNGLNILDLIKLGRLFGHSLYYDEEEDLVWKSFELYQKHKKYLEDNKNNNSSKK